MQRLLRLIARFCSRIFSPSDYENQVKKLRPSTRLQARAWKRWALSSYYWGQLWRCVVSGGSPDEWGVYYEDVNLVVSNLAPSDKPKLKRVRKTIKLEHFEEDVFDQMRRVLLTTAWKTYHAKLRFLTKFDPAMAPQDFVGEMMEVGIKVLRRYEETASEEIALAYAKKAIRNHALIVINHYTAGRRCRIEQDSGEREYHYRIINSSDITNSLPGHQDEVLFSSIRLWLGPRYERYARAVIQQEPDFEAWVQKHWEHKGRKTAYPQRSKTISRLAREWSGLSEAQVQSKLVPLLQDRLQDHLALSQPM
jgi:hypothetical protein